jgi:hypothetical protein
MLVVEVECDNAEIDRPSSVRSILIRYCSRQRALNGPPPIAALSFSRMSDYEYCRFFSRQN